MELFDLVKRVTYKPNSSIVVHPRAELDDIAAEIKLSQQLPNVNFPVEHPSTIGLVKKIKRKDLTKMTELDFMKLLRSWWHEFEKHEVDEWLRLEGATVVDPHPEKRMYDLALKNSMRSLEPTWWQRLVERWRATA